MIQDSCRTAQEDRTISEAIAILEGRLKRDGALANPGAVKHFLRLKAQGLPHEVFAVMYLDPQLRLIAYEPLFRGTLTHGAVYPREVVKEVLKKNAASVILHHNHPGGCCIPTVADTALTIQLRHALSFVDVRVVDHVITSDEDAHSFAENQN